MSFHICFSLSYPSCECGMFEIFFLICHIPVWNPKTLAPVLITFTESTAEDFHSRLAEICGIHIQICFQLLPKV